MAPIDELSNGLKNFSHDVSKGWEEFSKTFGSNLQASVQNLFGTEKTAIRESSSRRGHPKGSSRHSANAGSSAGTKPRKKKSPEDVREGSNLRSIRTKPLVEEEEEKDLELLQSNEESTVQSSFSSYVGDWIPEAEEVQRLRPPLPSPKLTSQPVKTTWSNPSAERDGGPLPGVRSTSAADSISYAQFQNNGPINREDLGRATWAFLHTLAAQYPEKPTKQQQRDVKEFLHILTRIYPCRICSEHFKEVIKNNPPEVGSRADLSYYMCRIHNVVNRSLNKPQFPCQRVENRWGTLDCEDDACSMDPQHSIGKK